MEIRIVLGPEGQVTLTTSRELTADVVKTLGLLDVARELALQRLRGAAEQAIERASPAQAGILLRGGRS